MAEVTAILLAAGLSQRMGDEDKLFLPFRGKTIVEHTLDHLLASDATDIVVVASPDTEARLKPFASDRVSVVVNDFHKSGMTSSIQEGIWQAGVMQAKKLAAATQQKISGSTGGPMPEQGSGVQNADTKKYWVHPPWEQLESDSKVDDQYGLMICLGDQPLIQPETYNQVIHEFLEEIPADPMLIALPFYQGQKGNPVIFASHYLEMILGHKEAEGCKGIVKANASHIIQVEVDDPGVLTDIDTREDYDRISD